jgi:hypothetical protein
MTSLKRQRTTEEKKNTMKRRKTEIAISPQDLAKLILKTDGADDLTFIIPEMSDGKSIKVRLSTSSRHEYSDVFVYFKCKAVEERMLIFGLNVAARQRFEGVTFIDYKPILTDELIISMHDWFSNAVQELQKRVSCRDCCDRKYLAKGSICEDCIQRSFVKMIVSSDHPDDMCGICKELCDTQQRACSSCHSIVHYSCFKKWKKPECITCKHVDDSLGSDDDY